jgi:hypothetical protein
MKHFVPGLKDVNALNGWQELAVKAACFGSCVEVDSER